MGRGKKAGAPNAAATRKSNRLAQALVGGGEAQQPDAQDANGNQTPEELVAFYKNQIQELVANKGPAKKKKKSNMSATDRAMMAEVKKGTNEFLFPTLKFLDDDTQKAATEKLFDYLDLKEKEGKEGPALEIVKQIWVQEWMETVREQYNSQQNYVTQLLHDLLVPLLKANKLDAVPTPAQLELVAKRQGMGAKDPDAVLLRATFGFYWDKLVPTVAGFSSWGPNFRYYQCMTDAKKDPMDPKSRPCVTDSDEAFLVALYTNMYNKWVYTYNTCHLAKKTPDKDAPEMKTPYTNPKSGQVKFGGWTEDGKKAFQKLKKEIKDERKKKHVKALEEEVLLIVRGSNNWDEVDKKREEGKKKRKKQPPKQAEARKVLPSNMDDWE